MPALWPLVLVLAMFLMAFDPKGAVTLAAAKALAGAGVRDTLVKYGTWLTGSEANAEDAMHEAFLLICDPAHRLAWDGRRPFGPHMRIAMLEFHRSERRKAANRREKLDDEGEPGANEQDSGDAPDDRVGAELEMATFREWGRDIRPRLSGRALRVFEWLCEDDAFSNEDLARKEMEAAGGECTPLEIQNAKRQIIDHARSVRDEREARRQAEALGRQRAAAGRRRP